MAKNNAQRKINSKQVRTKSCNRVDYECMKMYDDIFGTKRGVRCLEPDGLLAYDPSSKRNYFCLYEAKEIFIDRCQRSLELGRNLFVEEWQLWEGYKEKRVY